MKGAQSSEKIDPTSVIRAIWNGNRDEVLGRVVAIEEAVAAIIEKRLTPEGRETAEREAHKLAGAAGTFGFGRASESARKIEGILSGTDHISLDLALIAANEVVALRSDLSRDPSPVMEPVPDCSSEPMPAAYARQTADGQKPQNAPSVPIIVIAVTDRGRRKQLAAVAIGQGFRPLIIGAHGSIPLEGPPPGAALIDLGGGDGSLALIAGLAALDPPVPSLALAPQDSPWDRVLAARAGARRFVNAEASPEEIFSAAQNLLSPQEVTRSTVLVLTHLPAILSSVRSALQNEGMRVVGLTDPTQFWTALEKTQQDLVILESCLPRIGGEELCRVLRIDAQWAGLPVLLLTAGDDAAAVAALFDAGADDVITSPFVGTELAGRVRNRLKRTRVLHAHIQAARDGDGLADHAPLPTTGNVAAEYDVDVVVVEDDPLLSELLNHALTTRGYRFRHFTDGQVAAGELSGSPPLLRSRVVLLDVDLPSLNGFGVLRQMAMTDNLTATRVIMLTAHSSEPDIVNALKLGAFDHVAKPFSVPVLMQRVRGALGD
ncbi:DNA-binding response OmpR family regulator [Arthrobacter sp. CAN_A214]|uniref:response regulator n=1 Tax=Arthrobacter sp. CAN_A214 TaxID=2787720 RepID=UPI0018CB140B